MSLKGKTAIITGGGTGIGRATALRLAEKGVNIVVNYSRSEQEAQATLEEIKALGVNGFVFRANVAEEGEIEAMVEETIKTFGQIDILVNNAGTTDFVELDDLAGLRSEHWDRAFSVNTKGVFMVSRACADHLKKSKGAIVNITSIAGLTGAGSSIAYAASKAAAISVTKSLARVLAPDVRVNAIAPGIVMTRWVEGKEDHVERLSAGTPLGRASTPEDIAEVALGLVENAGFVTGQTIVVDGGFTL
ncbi:SDR family NAD(P)-dependent oxidoreductase [Halalkalibacter oceani]|uniref:Glucose 1-dehydrogenase n=1 Tax=Halalkalibacter oceani TaxID=1653776 RepID=A0A9X2DUN4_9BACI|nr:glucose 1-dehydrogenase [Halalkalibacter oceani]MCM3716400.1 glucose 1-dehydrogenase [Halalkalibacter oceani]